MPSIFWTVARIMDSFTERHADKIAGTLSCFDRIIVTGTIPGICYADGMRAYLTSHGIRLFDYKKWAQPLRARVRENAQTIAAESGLQLTDARSRKKRKEDLVAKALAQRGHEKPGMVAILWSMESCPTFEPWHDKQKHETRLYYKQAQCCHYYFYFILPELGLCYLRVPTWAPFRLQFYCNGHNWLAARLRDEGVGFKLLDNAFVSIDDWDRAQELADELRAEILHPILDRLARRLCPVVDDFPQGVHWSLMQAEYATDIVFKRQSDLQPLYENITRTAIHSVKPENIATFLGRKLNGNYRDEMGNNFHTRIEGTCVKHHMGKVSIKMYDKFNMVLRVETTVNDVKCFKQWRQVRRRDGSVEMKMAPMPKHIYSLPALREAMRAANARYLDFIAAIDDPGASLKDLARLSRPVREKTRSLRGFNLFNEQDVQVLRTIVDGGFCATGIRHQTLRQRFPEKSAGQISYLLQRLRQHGLIKKVGRSYKYYVTRMGRRVALLGLRLKEMFIIPALTEAIEQPA